MQDDFGERGVQLLGITSAESLEADLFRNEQGLNYPVLADAQAVTDAWGVKRIWGSVVYLIGPDGKVLTRGLDETRAELQKRLPG